MKSNKLTVSEIFALLISIFTLIVTQIDNCTDIPIMERSKKNKILVLSEQQFPNIKVIPTIDSISLYLDKEKYRRDLALKRTDDTKSLVPQYSMQIYLNYFIENISPNTAVINSIDISSDSTFYNDLTKVKSRQYFNTLSNFESKIKYIAPGQKNIFETNVTISYLNEKQTFLNLLILYKNSSLFNYYKYYGIKVKLDSLYLDFKKWNRLRMLPEKINIPLQKFHITKIIQHSNSLSENDYSKLLVTK